jgi:hypothetical protein
MADRIHLGREGKELITAGGRDVEDARVRASGSRTGKAKGMQVFSETTVKERGKTPK